MDISHHMLVTKIYLQLEISSIEQTLCINFIDFSDTVYIFCDVCMYVCMYIYSKHFTELRNIIIHDHDEAFVYCTNRQTGNVRERV